MSYILNALKQSESRRNRGEIPHIDSQPEFVKAAPSTWTEHIWKWLALAAAVALLLGLAWMRFGAGPSAVQAPTAVSPPLAEPVNPAALARSSAQEQAPGLSALEEMAGVRISLGEDPGAVAPAAPPPGGRESPRVVLEMPVGGGVASRPAPPSLAAAQAAAPPVVRETPSAEVLSGVSHWKTLPAEVQKQVREMAFTAHVYSSDPAARFIRVSGRTLHEGDPLAAGLQLQQITRDGIVFGYRGDRFWFGVN